MTPGNGIRDTMRPPRHGKLFDTQLTDSIELLSVSDAAALIGISASGMRRLQQERRIPFFKVGRRIRFAKSDLGAYLATRKIEPVG